MFSLLGSVVGAWFVYILVSLCFKHKGGVIVLWIYCIGSILMFFLAGVGDLGGILGGIICIILVSTISQLQVRNGKTKNKKN